MSIPMDLPPKEPAMVMMVRCDLLTAANSFYGIAQPRARAMSPEKKAALKQQEGVLSAVMGPERGRVWRLSESARR